jgi:hypothetical protein
MIMERVGGGEEILEPLDQNEAKIQPMSAKPQPLDEPEEEGYIFLCAHLVKHIHTFMMPIRMVLLCFIPILTNSYVLHYTYNNNYYYYQKKKQYFLKRSI